MNGTRITHQKDGRILDGESHCRHENNSPEDGELNGWHENNSPKGWKTTHQTDGRHKNNSPKQWTDGELNGL